MDSSDWSNGIRYHTFDTRPDTEFKPLCACSHSSHYLEDAEVYASTHGNSCETREVDAASVYGSTGTPVHRYTGTQVHYERTLRLSSHGN